MKSNPICAPHVCCSRGAERGSEVKQQLIPEDFLVETILTSDGLKRNKILNKSLKVRTEASRQLSGPAELSLICNSYFGMKALCPSGWYQFCIYSTFKCWWPHCLKLSS